ncbi:hypothetical protein KSP40_PGU010136 [Platanthera guangdongensis]|uniref:Uncharacterized protein n=1 Tax=Platanthera guangdongensis TaxID=2320717 RepID=A0ABR2LMB4_9ASPA
MKCGTLSFLHIWQCILKICSYFFQSFSSAKDILWSRDLFADSLNASGHTRADGVTKLYISNLDYGESSEDIKVCRFLIINADFDMNGRPSVSFIQRVVEMQILLLFTADSAY